MRTFHRLSALLLLWANPVHAQQDTLDWRRYYPLEVGNTWEYTGIDGAPHLEIRTLVGDTLANGHRYYIRHDSIPLGNRSPEVRTYFVRYDAAGVVVTLVSVQADTAAVPLSFPYEGGEDFLGHFDLTSSFGDILYEAPDLPYFVSGGYDRMVRVGLDTVTTDAVKCVHASWWEECFATDVGFIEGGSLQRWFLTHARVGGEEYGKSRATSIAVDRPAAEVRAPGLSVYPNPVRGAGTIVFALERPEQITMDLYNPLGQSVRSQDLGERPAGRHEHRFGTSDLASGIYLVRITMKERTFTHRVVIIGE